MISRRAVLGAAVASALGASAPAGLPMPERRRARRGEDGQVCTAYTELLGGALLVLGLFTRLASIPLFINMLVATLTVKMKKVAGLDDFVELDEPLYALSFLWLLFSGPGPVSLDGLGAAGTDSHAAPLLVR